MATSHPCRRVVALLASACIVACSPSVPLVAHGPHPATGGVPPIAVDTRPPPVKVQVIPKAPGSDCQWADGEWEWRSGEWRWQEGSWLSKSSTCYFADAVFVWLPARDAPTGVLYYTPSQWYDQRTNEPCEKPTPCVLAPDGE